jgi:hypothetical protein
MTLPDALTYALIGFFGGSTAILLWKQMRPVRVEMFVPERKTPPRRADGKFMGRVERDKLYRAVNGLPEL